jgi:steroid delta-isomerase-like uncharacterized protein
MTRDEIEKLFAVRQAAWNARDAEALARSHSEYCTVASPMFATRRGRPAILEAYQSLFRSFPDWTYTSEGLIIDGDRVAEPFIVTATHIGEFMGLPGTGRRFAVQGALVFKLENGLIVDERRIYDFSGLLIQIGILRTKPGKAQ